MRLWSALLRILVDSGRGEVFCAPLLVEFTGTDDRVQPDLLSVSNERQSIIGERQVLGAPDLVIEILSPSTAHRDRGIKPDLYARHGVRQYWIVDPDEDVVDVWRFADEPGHERFYEPAPHFLVGDAGLRVTEPDALPLVIQGYLTGTFHHPFVDMDFKLFVAAGQDPVEARFEGRYGGGGIGGHFVLDNPVGQADTLALILRRR